MVLEDEEMLDHGIAELDVEADFVELGKIRIARQSVKSLTFNRVARIVLQF